MIDMRYRGPAVAMVGGPWDGATFHAATPAGSWPVYLDDDAAPVAIDDGYAALVAGVGYIHWFKPQVHAYIHASVWPLWRDQPAEAETS